MRANPIPGAKLDEMLLSILEHYGTDGAPAVILADLSGRSVKTIKPHLSGLKRDGKVESTKAGVGARWYIAGKMLVRDRYQSIVDYVDANPGCEGRDIIAHFGLTGAQKTHYLRRLFEGGDCRVVKADKYVNYRYWLGGGVSVYKPRYMPVASEEDEKPFRHVIVPASEAPPLRVRMGVRSVFELANV